MDFPTFVVGASIAFYACVYMVKRINSWVAFLVSSRTPNTSSEDRQCPSSKLSNIVLGFRAQLQVTLEASGYLLDMETQLMRRAIIGL